MPFLTLEPSHRSASGLKSIIYSYDEVLGLSADTGTPRVLLNMHLIDDGWSDNASVQERKWSWSTAL